MTLTIESVTTTEFRRCWDGDHADTNIEDLPWRAKRTVEMTVENRGAVVPLQRTQRARWRDRIWYGDTIALVEIRVWHDGSISIEREEAR